MCCEFSTKLRVIVISCRCISGHQPSAHKLRRKYQDVSLFPEPTTEQARLLYSLSRLCLFALGQFLSSLGMLKGLKISLNGGM
ncbi:hypothetical protein RRG08_050352 [Elysia crispata]|uniref:Uncharacterized protein n=1 Tax=Elysia crispata TaxID=231223 RepID=A0AAE0XTD2_9GAST|nr:hypothetical protein RRG08_050352 [Elysia crispata]